MKIKDLNHALEFYESGVLIPMKSVLVDCLDMNRLFLGISLNNKNFATLSHCGEKSGD